MLATQRCERLDAARDLALSSVGGLFHGGNANRNGGGKGRWQGEGKEVRTGVGISWSTSGLLPSFGLSHREREVRVPLLWERVSEGEGKGYAALRNLRVSRFSISTTKNITPATASVTNQ